MAGFEQALSPQTAKRIYDDERTVHTPIIFVIAAHSDSNWSELHYELAAVEFLTKPLLPRVIYRGAA